MGFDRLNHDCISSILEYVDDVSPQTTKSSIRFVNKEFYATTKIIGHRRKVLRFPPLGYCCHHDPDPADLDISAWLTHDDVLRGLRYLTIATAPLSEQMNNAKDESRQQEQRKFGNLISFITKLGNLKLLNWSYRGPIPLGIVEALHKYHPKAELQVYFFGRHDATADHQDPAELALANSPNLSTIKASLWGLNDEDHPDLREAAFKRVVACAPNLRFASVVTGHSGCVINIPTAEQLEELEQLSAKFFTHKKPNAALRTLTLDGYPLNQETLKDWGKLVDLSRLESLKCSRGLPDASYFTYAPLVLTSLKHVSLNLGYRSRNTKDLIQNYIQTIAPLESLSLWSWMGSVPLPTILSQHGETLRTLQLHERETTANFDQERRQLLSVDGLRAIKAHCSNLQDLTIDMDRHSKSLKPEVEFKHYADRLETLASMNLDKLQIYFDLGIATMIHSSDATYESPGEEEHEPDSRPEEVGSPAQTESDKSPAHSSPPHFPPRKRIKKVKTPAYFSPSPDEAIEPFVKELWKKIFDARPNGTSRALDVKFGEWERKMGRGRPAHWVLEEQAKRSWWIVRPDERDDRPGECVVTKHGGGSGQGPSTY